MTNLLLGMAMEIIGGFGTLILFVASLFTGRLWMKIGTIIGIIMTFWDFLITMM